MKNRKSEKVFWNTIKNIEKGDVETKKTEVSKRNVERVMEDIYNIIK